MCFSYLDFLKTIVSYFFLGSHLYFPFCFARNDDGNEIQLCNLWLSLLMKVTGQADPNPDPSVTLLILILILTSVAVSVAQVEDKRC